MSLITAVKNYRLKEVEKFLKSGHHVDEPDDQDRTPLYWAARKGYLKIAKLLLSFGADCNKADKYDGFTPLIVVIWNPWTIANAGQALILKMVKLLLSFGADINKRDTFGESPFHYAARQGYLDVVQILLSLGVDFDKPNKYGDTPLFIAEKKGHSKIVTCLKYHMDKLNRLAELFNSDVWINDPELFVLLPKQFINQTGILIQIFETSTTCCRLPLELFHSLLIDLWGLYFIQF